MNGNRIAELVKLQAEYLTEQRNLLHKMPEVSGKELGTIEYLKKELTALGIEHIEVPDGGILGFIDSKNPGKTVLLRADVDALPMKETPDNLKGPKVAVSENEGACHACGHDGHMAMLLAAGKVLAENKDLLTSGRVILFFERGEELTGNVVFLHKYIEDNKIHIDSAWGIHLYSDLEEGKISLPAGPVMAGNITYDLKIKGTGGHGSRPDQSVSPIEAFSAVNTAMNTVRMNKINPFTPFTASIGYVRSGTVRNIIPETLEFGGTMRLFDMTAGEEFKKNLLKITKSVGEAYDCEITGNINGPHPAVINDDECSVVAKKAVTEVLGGDCILDVEPWMASEKMSATLIQWPGVFALVGIKNDDKGYGAAHHNSAFDFGEVPLVLGATAAVAYACEFLASDVDTSDRKWKKSVLDLYKFANRERKILDWLEGKTSELKL